MSNEAVDITNLFVFKKTEDINKYYKLGPVIGDPGTFGVARKARARKKIVTDTFTIQKGQKVAIKIVSKIKFQKNTEDYNKFLEDLRSEIIIGKTVGKGEHPNVIQFYQCYEDKASVYFVMEYCNGGDMFRRLYKMGSYCEADAAKILYQIVDAIRYLHEHKIAHCDIKPENFLFSDKTYETIKIIDFGVSKILKSDDQYLPSIVGSPSYLAPEVLDRKYNQGADMWSVGVVMFVLLFGFQPFTSYHSGASGYKELFRAIRKGFNSVTKNGFGPWFPTSIKVGASAKDLMTKLMQKKISSRLTAEEALAHPWLTGKTASTETYNPLILRSFQSFRAGCKFKQKVLMSMSSILTPDNISSLKNTFKEIDKDNDGHITAVEMKEALSTLGKDNPHLSSMLSDGGSVEKIMARLDVNRGGTIEYEEMLMAVVERQISAKEERIWEAFNKLDLNNDGFVSIDEVKMVFKEEKIEHIKQMFSEVDLDNDGKLSFFEFKKMWKDSEPADYTKIAQKKQAGSTGLLAIPNNAKADGSDVSDVSDMSEFSDFEMESSRFIKRENEESITQMMKFTPSLQNEPPQNERPTINKTPEISLSITAPCDSEEKN